MSGAALADGKVVVFETVVVGEPGIVVPDGPVVGLESVLAGAQFFVGFLIASELSPPVGA